MFTLLTCTFCRIFKNVFIFANSLSSNCSPVLAPFVMQQQHLVESTPDLYSQFSLNLLHINHFLVLLSPLFITTSFLFQCKLQTRLLHKLEMWQSSNSNSTTFKLHTFSTICVGYLQHRYLTELGRVQTGAQTSQLTMMIPNMTRFRITTAPVRYLFHADDSLVENCLCLHWSLFRIRQKPADTDAQKN